MPAHAFDIGLPELTATRKSNFLLPILFLPPPKREAIETIYAFCRYSDDIVDEEADVKEKYRRLLVWTNELQLALQGVSRYTFLNKLVSVIEKFHIPTRHFLDLLKGMEMDLTKSRYETFDELEQYCYRAASTVGLICAEVFGYHHERTKEYAVNLGIALQLTNILRDIKADAKKGRIYIPRADLLRLGYSEEMGYKYKPSSQVTWEQSPAYNVKVYRNPETIAKKQAMEDFMYWLEYDAEMKSEKQAENLVKFLKPLIAQYLGMNEEKVKAGEQELLEQWIRACQL